MEVSDPLTYSHPKDFERYEKRVTVFVCPVSGKGQAAQKWAEVER